MENDIIVHAADRTRQTIELIRIKSCKTLENLAEFCGILAIDIAYAV